MARAVAAQMPDRVASVITLASPIRKIAGHAAVMRIADQVRRKILKRQGTNVLPDCYTANCTCNFLESLMGNFPKTVRQTAIYSKCDGIMDWHVCRTGDPDIDIEVSSTHLGSVFSPLVYKVVAERLAGVLTSATVAYSVQQQKANEGSPWNTGSRLRTGSCGRLWTPFCTRYPTTAERIVAIETALSGEGGKVWRDELAKWTVEWCRSNSWSPRFTPNGVRWFGTR